MALDGVRAPSPAAVTMDVPAPWGHFPAGPTGRGKARSGRAGGQRGRGEDVRRSRPFLGPEPSTLQLSLGADGTRRRRSGSLVSAPRGPAAARAGRTAGRRDSFILPPLPLFRAQGPREALASAASAWDGQPAARAEGVLTPPPTPGLGPEAAAPGPWLGATQFAVLYRHLVDTWPPFLLISRKDGGGRVPPVVTRPQHPQTVG